MRDVRCPVWGDANALHSPALRHALLLRPVVHRERLPCCLCGCRDAVGHHFTSDHLDGHKPLTLEFERTTLKILRIAEHFHLKPLAGNAQISKSVLTKACPTLNTPNKSDAGNGSYGVCFHFDILLLAVA